MPQPDVRFSEISARRRAGMLLLSGVQIGLLIAAELDIQQHLASLSITDRRSWSLAAGGRPRVVDGVALAVARTVEIELLAPAQGFAYRPIAVAEPYGLGEVRRLELARIAADQGAHRHQGALGEVDAAARVMQALELADAKARRGTYAFAINCACAAEDVAGPLPAARQAQPERRVCAGR